MKNEITMLNSYNTPDTVIMIATYPGRKNRSIEHIDAVASYTDHLSSSLIQTLRNRGKKFLILSQMESNTPSWNIENGILIGRIWKKGSVLCYAQILQTLFSYFNTVRSIFIQFEFHQFGGNTTTLGFPFFLGALKILNRSVSVVMHQVVEDIASLSGHLHLKKNSIRTLLFNKALNIFYTLSSIFSDSITTHNAVLASRFEHITGKPVTTVIPHGLGTIHHNISKKSARKLLGYKNNDYITLHFGFLTWYKGSDWLVKQFSHFTNKNVKLLMAGGESPNLYELPYYQKFIAGIKKTIDKTKSIVLTGFIADKNLRLYFAAADLVILPYRTLMSSSGPLAMAIAYSKPFILSKALLPYTDDPDFQSTLRTHGISAQNMSFALQPDSFQRAISFAQKNHKTLTALSKSLSQTRNWHVVSEKFADIIESTDYEKQKKFAIMGREPSLSYAS